MLGIAFLIFSLLYFPLSVVSEPEYLFVHLHSNRSTGGEVSQGWFAELVFDRWLILSLFYSSLI